MWLGQSGILITTNAGKRIYIDPVKLPEDPPLADFIFLTHPHSDHFTPKSRQEFENKAPKL
jgi:L-ascorbate metabolism protein UlaG (beta-lactamase superfamily)